MAVEMLTQLGVVLSALLGNMIMVIPGIVGALVVLVFGYIIAASLGWAVEAALNRLKVDRRLHKMCKVDLGKFEISGITGTITKWYIFIVFLGTAVKLVNLDPLSGFLMIIVNWLPNLIVAVIMLLGALLLGDYVQAKIRRTKIKGAVWVGRIVYWSIVILIGVIALNQIGINVSLLENVILLIVGSLAVGLSLALGISLGLGMKDEAKKMVKRMHK